MLMLMAALHVGADGAAFYWVVLLVKRNFAEMSPLQLGLVLSIINSSYLVGRLIMMKRPHRPLGLPHVAVLAPVAAVAMAAMAFWAPSYGWLLVLAWVAWFPLSINWPILQARAVDWFPDTPSASVGLLGAASAMGIVGAQYAVGYVSEQTGKLAIGFLVPVGMLLVLSVCAAALHLATRKEGVCDAPGS
jgi:predicted MFS family arabinose efflux permease